MDPIWFAVHTRPNSEHKAATYLQRQGYQTFYPFTRDKLYRGRNRKMLEYDRPWFSRYIFVALTKPTQSLFEVNETYGVSTVVRPAPHLDPLEIPAQVIGELMDMTDADGMIAPKPKAHWFKGQPGEMVALKDAPYYGLLVELASVADVDKRDEITVWLELLGAKREVVLSVDAVARIAA